MSFDRLADSQRRLRDAMMAALGVYSAKEASEADSWREKTLWQATEHLAHEVEEVKRSKELTRKLHNAYDCIGQAAIVAATIQLEIESRREL